LRRDNQGKKPPMPLTYSTRPPSPAGKRLALELRRIREQRGMSGDTVARKMKWSPSKVSRFERARTCVQPADVTKLLRLYQVPEARVQELTALAERAWGERNLEENARFEVAEVLAWAPLAVPLLLRTQSYHEAVLSTVQRVTPVSPGAIREAVSRNTTWQDRLTGDSPLTVRAVLDESVLRRQFGSQPVMKAQVTYLAKLARQKNVDLRVLAPDGGGPSFLPPFTYTRYADSREDLPTADEVETTTLTDPWLPEAEGDVWLHFLAFEQLAGAADQPADHLKRALADWS
jgi:transcriptional regulator with XRE-family HTH domain